jgi:rod shape-determining protein MreC
VILLTDLNSRVPVSIASSVSKSGVVQAIMTGDNTPMPTLEMVPGTATLHVGDQVVSSGDGGLLPQGLPMGTVVADGAGWRVALLADPASSQDVEILNFSQPPEQLPATAQLPAEAAGLKPHLPTPPAVALPATGVPGTTPKPGAAAPATALVATAPRPVPAKPVSVPTTPAGESEGVE